MAIRILVILGTRPEAIKLCPLVLSLREWPSRFQVHVCSTGQHRHLLEAVWQCFGVRPDSSLDGVPAEQSLSESSARILAALPAVFASFQPDLAVVQGDTTSTLCGALAAFYQRVPVAHVEAGLRSGDFAAPFPEEMNRILVGRMALLHFAATAGAAENLRSEAVAEERIHVTGNTGIDALRIVCQLLDKEAIPVPIAFPQKTRPRVVATMHRREALEGGMPLICEALNRLVDDNDLEVVFPVHANPTVRELVARELRPHPRIQICEPLDYVSFVALMRSADLAVTDSGGIQEEAPYLGVPVVVLREKTERPEGLQAGLAVLAGYDPVSICSASRAALFSSDFARRVKAGHEIYGDGQAAGRIRSVIASYFNR